MTSPYMPGLRLTQSQYAHQRDVKTFGDLIFDFEGYCLIHISRVIPQYPILEGICYKVHRYLSLGLRPFKEFSENYLFPGEAWFSSKAGLLMTGKIILSVALEKVAGLNLTI